MLYIKTIYIIGMLIAASLTACSNELATYTLNATPKTIVKQDLIDLIQENPDIYHLKDNIEAQQQLVRELVVHDILANQARAIGLDRQKQFLDTIEILNLWHMRQQYIRSILKTHYPDRYAAYKEETVDVHNIFISMRTNKKNPDPLEKKKALDEALLVANQAMTAIKNGSPFAQAALRYSDGISMHNAGHIGYMLNSQLKKMDPVFADAAFKLKPGAVSDPIKSETLNAYHIIHISDKRTIGFQDINKLPGKDGQKVKIKTIMEDNLIALLLPAIVQKWNVLLSPDINLRTPNENILTINNLHVMTKQRLLDLFNAYNQMRLAAYSEADREKKMLELSRDSNELRNFALFAAEAYALWHDAKQTGYSGNAKHNKSLDREINKLLAERYLVEMVGKKTLITDDDLKKIYQHYKNQNKNSLPFDSIKESMLLNLKNKKKNEFIHSMQQQKLQEAKYMLLKNNFCKFKLN